MDGLSSRGLNDRGVCDIADEEVHFSRDMVFYPHYQQQPFIHLTMSNQQQAGQAPNQPSSISATTQFTNVNLNHQQSAAAADQVRSSRLLNCIGSKLRRGTNYLAAPRLVGQYLLGITIQSWSEFFTTSRLMRAPSNTNQLTRRLLANLSYFQGNYLCVSLVLVIYCILTSPLLLLAIIVYLMSLYAITARSATGRYLRIAGYRPNLQQQYSFITLISLPLLWVAGAPSAVFWVIGASFVVVGLHASMYCIEQRPLTSGDLRTREHELKQQQSRSAVQYYNHYPTPQPRPYLSLSAAVEAVQANTNDTINQSRGAKPEGNFYTSALPQWMLFGTGSSSKSSDSALDPKLADQKSPNVKIISQDYAGLGRVYEV